MFRIRTEDTPPPVTSRGFRSLLLVQHTCGAPAYYTLRRRQQQQQRRRRQ